MPIQLMQFTMVLIGTGFVPSALNPVAVSEWDMIPKDWEWQVAGNVNTQNASAITYSNGVNIALDRLRLQIVDPGVSDGVKDSKVAEIAKRYIERFSQFGYSAIGINLNCIIDENDLRIDLANLLVPEVGWDKPTHPLKAAGIKLTYAVQGGDLSISLDEGEVEKISNGEKSKWTGILVQSNFHRDIAGPASGKRAIFYLENAESDWEFLKGLVDDIFPKKD